MTDPIDIVERLRRRPVHTPHDQALLADAADEITRLRAELVETHQLARDQFDLRAEQRDDRDRLRAALAAQVPQPVAGAAGLLPCPFCGWDDCDAVDLPPDNLRPTETHYIVCHECGLEGPLHDSRAEAAAAWNRRAAPGASPQPPQQGREGRG